MNNLTYFIIGILSYQVGLTIVSSIRRIILLKKLDREKKRFEENIKQFAQTITHIVKEDLKRFEHAKDLPFAGGLISDSPDCVTTDQRIQEAIDREDYELAAKLRDTLK